MTQDPLLQSEYLLLDLYGLTQFEICLINVGYKLYGKSHHRFDPWCWSPEPIEDWSVIRDSVLRPQLLATNTDRYRREQQRCG